METTDKNKGIFSRSGFTGDHFKRRANLKSLMSRTMMFFLLSLIVLLSSCENEDTNIEVYSGAFAKTVDFDFEGGQEDVSFDCKIALHISSYPKWITVTKTGDTGMQTFHLTALENDSNYTRSGYISLKGIKGESRSAYAATAIITVLQSGQQ